MNQRRIGPGWVALAILALASGCEKGGATGGAPSATLAASSAPAVAPPAASASARPAGSGSGWAGSYTAKIGQVDPPQAAHEKTWTQDPGRAAVGPGTIELAVASSGAAVGEAKGALGELAVTGTFDGRELRANLMPKNPNAEGAMTGWMALTVEGEPSSAKALKGTLRVASRDARLVREASVELARK